MNLDKDNQNVDTPNKSGEKRGSSAISPLTKEDSKKSKMADKNVDIETPMPSWAKGLAKVSDIETIMDNFKKTCFVPFQNNITHRIKTLEDEVKSIPSKISDLEKDFQKSLDFHAGDLKTMDTRMKGLEQENKNLNDKVNELYNIVHDEKEQNRNLKQKVIELEDRSRRDNLVIEGLDDEEKESKNDCERKAREYMKKDLKIENAKSIVIGRVHRLGKYTANKKRATIIKFDRYKERERVWEKRKKAPKGTRVKENFSRETDRDRSQLYPIMKAARDKGYYSRLDGNKLLVSNDAGIHVTCTVNSLDKLPVDLRPSTLFTPTQGNVTLFYTKHSPHSNFHACHFNDDGIPFNCVEQHLVYKNAKSVGDDALANRVLRTKDPAQIKALGKDITLDYDTRKEHMKKGMTCKYSQNPDLLTMLRNTGDKVLGEANPFDTYWGTGIRMYADNAFNEDSWADNWTGKILMEVREELCK